MKLFLLWGPVVLLMAFIFYASGLSDPGAPPGGMSDKSAHFLVYAALGGALIRALAEGLRSRMTLRRIAIATLIAVLYGVSDEVHQSFIPNRTPDVRDLAADAAGALAGAALLSAAARMVGRHASVREKRTSALERE